MSSLGQKFPAFPRRINSREKPENGSLRCTESVKSFLSGVVLLSILLPVFASAADEVAVFRLTNLQAFIELFYRKNVINNQATGIETAIDDSRQQVELGMSTNSYIFHPKLLQMRFAGGLIFDRQDINREQSSLVPVGTTQSGSGQEQVLLNLDTSFQFLKDKPYPTTFSYFRANPVVRTGLEGSFTQTTERYGVDFELRDILPVSFSVNASRDSSFGESLDRIVDFTSDRVSVRSRKSFSSGDRIALHYELSSRNSRNGDPARTIQETLRQSQHVLLTSNWRLGSRDQLQIDQTARFNRRDNPDVTDINFVPRFRWEHSPTLQSRYSYSFNQSERPEAMVKIRSETASAALHYSPTPELNGLVQTNVDRSVETNRLLQNARGFSSRVNYKRGTRTSQLNLSLGLGYQRKDQDSQVTQISVLEEVVVLVGTTPVSLSRDFIILDTVIVRNETGTQTLIEGVDYRLIEIGSRTQIERLIGGSILDGETVLVDYDAKTGGTFEYSLVNQTLNADFRFAKYHNIFLRYRSNMQTLESGFSTLPFNSVEALEIGLREQLPLRWGGLQLYGEARYLRQDEDINPFNQKSILASLQAPLPHRLNLTISASRNFVDNLNSDEDSDMTVFNANLTWQARRNLTVRAEGHYDEDTGGTLLRRRSRAKLSLQWRFRRISIGMDARYEDQQQGEVKNDNYEFWLRIRRELF